MMKFSIKRAGLSLAALALATGCGQAEGNDNSLTSSGEVVVSMDPDTKVMSIGAPDAPVVLAEYASVTCGHCRDFHLDVLPMVKSDYVATGQVRFEFREFPTPPADVAYAGFMIARCVDTENYFTVLDDLFENQRGILRAYQQQSGKEALEAVAERNGLDTVEFEACLQNTALIEDIEGIVDAGGARGVSSTPTLLINDRILSGAEGRTEESMRELLDAALENTPN